jgi:hypothetical protein
MGKASTITQAQRQARQSNARLSKGPKSPEGLARCKQARLRHGRYSAEYQAQQKTYRQAIQRFVKLLALIA